MPDTDEVTVAEVDVCSPDAVADVPEGVAALGIDVDCPSGGRVASEIATLDAFADAVCVGAIA